MMLQIRGRQIEQLISDHCLCLLNNDEKTYFHAPRGHFTPRSSHLFANSATDVEFRGCKRSAQQRSFPSPKVSHVNGQLKKQCSMSLKLFEECCRCSHSQNIQLSSKAVQTMVERFLPTSQRNKGGRGVFSEYPTTDNLIAFKRAKALARRIRRQCQREFGSSMCLQSHRQIPANSYGERLPFDFVSPHKSLNSSRGVISEPDLIFTPETEILEEFSGQGVIQVTKLSTTTTTTQTDENITKIVCPPLKLLQPLVSVPKPTISSSVAAVNKSSTSTQAELVPSTSLVTVASPSISQPPNSVIDTAPTTSNSLSISATSSSSTACSVLETTTTISIPYPLHPRTQFKPQSPVKKKTSPKKPIQHCKNQK
ncbi:hypothetical protein TNCV_1539341 [Trichonephila clavipes]|nr:hypothetical protein TNCV_1539341 [Trichonephila clavipes]